MTEAARMIGPLREHALYYAAAGLPIFPLRADKTPYVSQHLATTDIEQVALWWDEWPDALIGYRVPDDQVLLDIDPRHQGDKTWLAIKALLGDELPLTRTHRSGRGDGGGHVHFKRPDGVLDVAGLDAFARANGGGHAIARKDGTDSGRWTGGIDLLQHDHRYSILPPSPHPDTGLPYVWARGLDVPVAAMPEALCALLAPVERPRLAQPHDFDNGLPSLGDDSIADWYSEQATWVALLGGDWTLVEGDGEEGSKWRHPTATSAFSATITNDCLFVYSPNTVFAPTSPGAPHGYTKFAAYAELAHRGDMREAAREARATKTARAPSVAPRISGADTSSAIVMTNEPSRFHRGGAWLLDAPSQPPAIWGSGAEVLWAQGEPFLLTGPPGVGKTTLTGQLLRCRIGLQAELLGWPVQPDEGGKVLYLAADRPSQIRRALARSFTADERDHLDQRLVVWAGPPATDLAANPDHLRQLCAEAGATTVVLDSLKDMALGLSDDAVGAGLNRALQLCIAEGTEVAALHHQRKGTDGKRPKTLEDLYGSTWIAAGAGSIVLLWGQPGDLVVDLFHLKQPANDVGPLKLVHDHDHGVTTIEGGFDLVACLRHRGAVGISASQMASLWLSKAAPNGNDRRKAMRRLDNLVTLGIATKGAQVREGDGTLGEATYRWVDPIDRLSTGDDLR